jgi:SAM-dependent methyltransferase
MVGSGRLLPGLRDAGYHVVGFDRSAPMLARARERGKGVPLFRADAGRFSVAAAFDGAYCPIDSFRYLLREDDAVAFLDALARALRPGSPFILGLELESPDPPVPDTWTTHAEDGRRVDVRILSHGGPAPDIQWMDAEVTVSSRGAPPTVHRSRQMQRRWTPDRFLGFLDALDAFDVAGVWRRSQETGPPLDGLPPRGGPVVVMLVRA